MNDKGFLIANAAVGLLAFNELRSDMSSVFGLNCLDSAAVRFCSLDQISDHENFLAWTGSAFCSRHLLFPTILLNLRPCGRHW